MKRKHESSVVHVTESCDEWLSTRNKHKIKPPSPKPKRRKSNVYRGFPRQSSSSLWHLTQSAPPHPLLVTATKQSTIQGFFKPAQEKQDKGKTGKDERSETPCKEEIEEIKEVEEIHNSSSETECDFHSTDLEFDPFFTSTVKIVSNDATMSQSSKIEANYPIRLDKLWKLSSAREATLDALDEAPDCQPGTAAEHLLPCIDLAATNPKEHVCSQDSVLTVRKTARQSSHLSIFRDSYSTKSFDINENSISFYKKKKSPISLPRHLTKSPDDSLVFTQDDSWDARLLEDLKNRRPGKTLNSSGCEILNKASKDESLDFIDNSLTFTETQSDNTQSHERRPSLLKLEYLMDDQVSVSVLKIVDSIGQQRVNKKNKTLAADTKCDIREGRFHNTRRNVQTSVNSPRSRTATSQNMKKHCSKAQPLTQVLDSEDDVGVDADCSRHSSLQGEFDVKQADQYHNSLEHPASELTMSDDVNSLDLSQSELCPRATSTTGSAKTQRPSWLTRLRENSKKSCGQNGKHVIENLKFKKCIYAKDSSVSDADDELLLNTNSLEHECLLKSEHVRYRGGELSSVDTDNSLRFTPTQN